MYVGSQFAENSSSSADTQAARPDCPADGSSPPKDTAVGMEQADSLTAEELSADIISASADEPCNRSRPRNDNNSPDRHSSAPPFKQKVRHRKVKQGQTIFKGHSSWNIMMNLKLGINYTVCRQNIAEDRPLVGRDFRTVYKQTFPPSGSSSTPAHTAGIFQIKDHAPLAFKHLREHFGVAQEEYVFSLCGEHSMRELGTPGKSGAVFYLTEDSKFLLKTVSKKESKFLRRILPHYYAHVMRCENSLLPRFFGLLRITTASSRNIRMVVMNNLMPERVYIYEKYDLKGSTLGRYATTAERSEGANCTLKDLDFKHSFAMDPRYYDIFCAQLETDCGWLKVLGIMDYSMLTMLHFPGREPPEDEMEEETTTHSPESCCQSIPVLPTPMSLSEHSSCSSLTYTSGASSLCSPSESSHNMSRPNSSFAAGSPCAMCVSQGDASDSRMSSSCASRFSRIKSILEVSPRGSGAANYGEDDGDSDEDDASSSTVSDASLPPKLTDEELALAYVRSRQSRGKQDSLMAGIKCSRLTAERTWEDAVIYCGIIDVLQQYGARKRIEHRYKSLRYAAEKWGISVTDPTTYSTRFFNFIMRHMCAVEQSAAAQLAVGTDEPVAISDCAADSLEDPANVADVAREIATTAAARIAAAANVVKPVVTRIPFDIVHSLAREVSLPSLREDQEDKGRRGLANSNDAIRHP